MSWEAALQVGTRRLVGARQSTAWERLRYGSWWVRVWGRLKPGDTTQHSRSTQPWRRVQQQRKQAMIGIRDIGKEFHKAFEVSSDDRRIFLLTPRA